MRHVGCARRQGSDGFELSFEREVDWRRIRFGLRGQPWHRRAGRREDDSGACLLALNLSEDRIGTVPRKINQNVEPLGQSERETAGAHCSDGMAVHGHDGAGKRAEIGPELCR